MSATTASADSALVRAIGVWGLAAGIVNVTVGGGIFRLPANVAAALSVISALAGIIYTFRFSTSRADNGTGYERAAREATATAVEAARG